MTTPTSGMKGGGYYDEHSEYQARVAQSGLTPLIGLIDAMDARADPLTVVDYGCSEGANSIAAVRAVLLAVRRQHQDLCVVAVHNDLPSNDFNALFHNLAERDDSYLTVPGGPVLPLASPRSFYETVVPRGAASVGLSFSAAHWFRAAPGVSVPGSICAMDATGTAQAALAAQADQDWTRFLTMRASDLAPGGVLFVQMIGTAVDADGTRHVTASRLLRAMADTATGMVEVGQLRAEVLAQFVFPTYMRTVEEARAPLERPGSPVAGRFRAELVSVDPVPNPYLDALHAGRRPAGLRRALRRVRPGVHRVDPPPGAVRAGHDRPARRCARRPLLPGAATAHRRGPTLVGLRRLDADRRADPNPGPGLTERRRIVDPRPRRDRCQARPSSSWRRRAMPESSASRSDPTSPSSSRNVPPDTETSVAADVEVTVALRGAESNSASSPK